MPPHMPISPHTHHLVPRSKRPPLLRTRPPAPAPLAQVQCRHATLLRRPLRPYTFTQLLTLSDGSTTITRTTSPAPVYRSVKDARNHPMWNPSSQELANIEEDEAGRLRAFRRRFGRGWDAEATATATARQEGDEEDDNNAGGGGGGHAGATGEEEEDGLMDLISGYQANNNDTTAAGAQKQGTSSTGKAKGKKQ